MKRHLTVPSRLWWGIWTLWSLVLVHDTALPFVHHFTDLPHNHVAGALLATAYAFLAATAIMFTCLAVRFLIHPPQDDDDDT